MISQLCYHRSFRWQTAFVSLAPKEQLLTGSSQQVSIHCFFILLPHCLSRHKSLRPSTLRHRRLLILEGFQPSHWHYLSYPLLNTSQLIWLRWDRRKVSQSRHHHRRLWQSASQRSPCWLPRPWPQESALTACCLNDLVYLFDRPSCFTSGINQDLLCFHSLPSAPLRLDRSTNLEYLCRSRRQPLVVHCLFPWRPRWASLIELFLLLKKKSRANPFLFL